MQPEARLSRDIRNALTARGAFVFKIHGGPTMMAGLPDLIACVPMSTPDGNLTYGSFVGLEQKMPGGVPSVRQMYVHEQIRRAGGRVIVPRSVKEAIEGVWG